MPWILIIYAITAYTPVDKWGLSQYFILTSPGTKGAKNQWSLQPRAQVCHDNNSQ